MRFGGRAAAIGAIALLAAACVPPTTPSGPPAGPLAVSVELSGAYEYATSGPVEGGSLTVHRDGDGRVMAIDGTATFGGRGAQPATATFDLHVVPLVGLATGSVDVVDPAAGIAVTTPVVLGDVAVTGDTIRGAGAGQRIWRIVELKPFSLRWAIGPATSSPTPPPAISTATSGTLKVLTYNVAGLPEPFSGSKPTENNVRISPLLNDYDLVLLQEDFFYIDQVAKHIDHPYGSPPQRLPLGSDATRPSAFVGSGLERYARHPFDGYAQIRWPGCFGDIRPSGASDCLSQKGFSVAQHHLADGVTVDVYDLHGEAGSTPDDVFWSAADYVALADYINANSVGHAIIVGGDFNLHPEESPDAEVLAKLLADADLDDVCDTVDCSEDPTSIDRVLYRSSADLTLTPTFWDQPDQFSPGGRPLSDHPAVTATFTWQRT